MTIKDEYKNKIDEMSSASFNRDQKQLAKEMIDKAPEGQEHSWFQFIIQRVKLGFRFDDAPEVKRDAITLIKEIKDMRINVNDEAAENENKLIIGDNYDALKNLLVTHRNKIDVIYIDPPYNTEATQKDKNSLTIETEEKASTFIYRDKYSRVGWLNMIKERLVMAKELLSDSGTIFVSIDDSEQAYLKILMDEIFGEENFICNIIWKNRTTPNDPKINIATTHEYILTYSRNTNKVKFKGLSRNFDNYKNPDNDPNGPWIKDNPSAASGNYSFEIVNPYTNERYIPPKGRFWAFSEKRVSEWTKSLKMVFPKEKNKNFFIKKYKKDLKSLTLTHPSIFDKALTMHGTKQLKSILSNHSFKYPKPTELIKFLIDLINKKDILILDFFAGSGTTGHAVMELNRLDGGKRNFILCTNNENNIAKDVTYERLFRIINGRGANTTENFKWLDNNKPFKNEKLRVFSLEQHDVSIKTDPREIKELAKIEFRKLSPSYSSIENVNIYADLNSLHPYKKEKH